MFFEFNVVETIDRLRRGEAVSWPSSAPTLHFARSLDNDKHLVNLRDNFVIPTKASLKTKRLKDVKSPKGTDDDAIYFCGNSLGLQPKAVAEYISSYMLTWGAIAVGGHFTNIQDSPLVPYQDMCADCAEKSTDLFGASKDEIVIMNTLTVNLHLMMAAFYRPTEKKKKIMLEWRPFPSDYVSNITEPLYVYIC